MKLKIIIFFTIVLFHSTVSAQDISIIDKYKPGFGKPIGKIADTQGDAAIIHADSETAYRTKKELLLYMGDTIVTLKTGFVSIKLIDESTLSLTSNTKITIDRTVYTPKSGHRSGFLSIAFGKARFWIKKFSDFKTNEFKVKSKTAVVGVRGSDFVVDATEEMTSVSTLENTRLKLTLFFGCEKIDKSEKDKCEVRHYDLSDFQKASAEKDNLTPEITKLSQKEIQQINNTFPPVPDTGDIASPDAIYYSNGAYAKPDERDTSEAITIDEIDDAFETIEDDILDNITVSEENMPSYPYNPD